MESGARVERTGLSFTVMAVLHGKHKYTFYWTVHLFYSPNSSIKLVFFFYLHVVILEIRMERNVGVLRSPVLLTSMWRQNGIVGQGKGLWGCLTSRPNNTDVRSSNCCPLPGWP